jgi:hypothetical protein
MLHLETIEPKTLELLKRLQALQPLANTRLVGGTALALQFGHRVSVDLDIFGKWDLNLPLDALFAECGKTIREGGEEQSRLQFFTIDGIKVDCVTYDCPWLEPPIEENGVRIAGIDDIAAMKLNAITNRGTRKDFVDMAFILDRMPLERVFELFQRKYTNVNPALAWRSIVYFDDAEDFPMPKMLVPFDWEEAKNRILQAVRELERKRF